MTEITQEPAATSQLATLAAASVREKRYQDIAFFVDVSDKNWGTDFGYAMHDLVNQLRNSSRLFLYGVINHSSARYTAWNPITYVDPSINETRVGSYAAMLQQVQEEHPAACTTVVLAHQQTIELLRRDDFYQPFKDLAQAGNRVGLFMCDYKQMNPSTFYPPWDSFATVHNVRPTLKWRSLWNKGKGAGAQDEVVAAIRSYVV